MSQDPVVPQPIYLSARGVADGANELPWAGMWQRQCTASVEPNPSGYWGRCELRRGHGPDVDHALDRGLDFPRWSTRWTA